MSKDILLVEDEKILRKNYETILKKNGYEVMSFENVQDATEFIEHNSIDLAILDIMLEDNLEGGFQICKFLKEKNKQVPIVFLTALDTDVKKISAYELGAWDYLTKDISLSLFITKINSIFQKMELLSDYKKIDENIVFNDDTFEVFYNGQRVPLTKTQFLIANVLFKNQGRTTDYSLLSQVTTQKVVTDNAIAVHVRKIRKAFKKNDNNFDSIQTASKVGYIWK
ncbi:DNA-binding response regulator [hydrothermal vent metagenome]|uniref:DNA-binding response regulator n=1 Tax=hydrothermal vent metagenome TaxID=652676 RepID=A0A1W1BEP3_9ZZZZ